MVGCFDTGCRKGWQAAENWGNEGIFREAGE